MNKIREQNEKTLKQFLDKLMKSGMYDDFDEPSPGSDNSTKNSSTIDIEDIARALKISKESEDLNEQKQFNDNVDDLIDLTENILDKIKDADISQEDKEALKKELVDKIKDSLQDNDKDTASEEENNKSISQQLKDLAKRLEKEAAIQEKQFKNKDLDRSQIDKNIQLRIEKIADLFNDTAALNDALEESERAIYTSKEKRRKEESEEAIYQAKNYDKKLFLRQLDQLIKTQIAREREDTYKVPSKKKLFGANVVLKGKKWTENRNKPKVAVYYDRSGS